MAFLSVENYKKSFGDTEVLKGISFSLEKGQILAIIGSSGGGKTTLLRCLNFLETPDEGKLYLDGKLLFDAVQSKKNHNDDELREKRLHFGLVFQQYNLFPQYNVLDNITIARKLLAKERYRKRRAELKKEIAAAPASERPSLMEKSKEELSALSYLGNIKEVNKRRAELKKERVAKLRTARNLFETEAKAELASLENADRKAYAERSAELKKENRLKLREMRKTLEAEAETELASLEKSVRKNIIEQATALIERVGLTDKIKAYPCELSGGQCQRVAIARALALSPDVLCFDEPTSALDPELTGEVLKVIRGLKSGDRTMIVVTHEMEFARKVADKVIFISDGKIEEEGSPEDVFDNPKSEKTKAFLARAREKREIE